MKEVRKWQIIAGVLLVISSALALNACKQAHSQFDSVEIRYKVGPDGLSCYVAYQEGQARGLWCR